MSHGARPSHLRWAAVMMLLLGGTLAVRAQEKPLLRPTTDAELWLSLGVEVKPFKKKSGQVYEHKFYKRFRLVGELGYRGNENLTSSKLFYTVVGARYRLNKYLRFGAEHRYNFRDIYTSNTHRLDLDLSASAEVGKLAFNYRFIFQHEFTIPIHIRDILRNRLALEYNIPGWKFDPHVSMETFTALRYMGKTLIGLRYEVGTAITLDKKKKHTFDLALRHDREQNMTDLKYRWIFAVGYEYKWNR